MSLIDYREEGGNAETLCRHSCVVAFGLRIDGHVAAVDRLRVGMTKAEVIGLLGQPNQVVTNFDGSARLVWVHSTGSMFGANARSVGLPFDSYGKLIDAPK